ncbi:MAG: hypothetical protein ACYC3A_04370 [Halothiobacillus sp.]
MQQKIAPSTNRLMRAMFTSAALAAVLLSAGCANLPKPSAGQTQTQTTTTAQTPEQIVAARSEARAKAVVSGDYKQVYSYLTPEFRQNNTAEQYQMRFPQVYKLFEAKVLKVTCTMTDSCDAQVEWTYQLNGPIGKTVGPVPTVLNERWIKVDNQWWFYQKS